MNERRSPAMTVYYEDDIAIVRPDGSTEMLGETPVTRLTSDAAVEIGGVTGAIPCPALPADATPAGIADAYNRAVDAFVRRQN